MPNKNIIIFVMCSFHWANSLTLATAKGIMMNWPLTLSYVVQAVGFAYLMEKALERSKE